MAETYELTKQDVADILSGTLDFVRENGHAVAVKHAAETPQRPVGILIFVGNLALIEGKIKSLEETS